VPKLASRAAYAKQAIRDKLIDHRHHVQQYGDDMPEISGWKWGQNDPVGTRGTSTEGDNV
jgi:xylulose-5-phosphate/fructose-6-phosphate phosphoketolase